MKKTAIVTGGSRGIGFAIAKQLAADGFNIVIMDIAIPDFSDGKSEAIPGAVYFKGSLTEQKDRDACVAKAIESFGSVDALINNAGVAPLNRADLLEMTEESFDRVVGINTKGTMFMSQTVANQMLKQPLNDRRRGVIVNITSCSAVVSSTSRGEYCVSKAGISMLTTLFADRLAPEGIHVYEVRPGVIMTDMTSTVKAKYDKMIDDGVFPIARWGYPEDVAGVVSAFCSDKFLYTTGNYIDVDGGFHIKKL